MLKTVRQVSARTCRRAFSMIEMLIALTITATLLTATLAALDASFKSYQATTESASTHVVARIVMQRVTAMVRNGEQFGPYPVNPILTPVIESDWMEFVVFNDDSTNTRKVATLRKHDNGDGTFALAYIITTSVDGTVTSVDERPLIDDLVELTFRMEYDVGPRLRTVTIDMVIQPDDLQGAAIESGLRSPAIRLVASASPRRIEK